MPEVCVGVAKEGLAQPENWKRSVTRQREKQRVGGVGGGTVALLYFLIELLSAQVAIQPASACRLLACQINIDSLLSAFPSSLSIEGKESDPDLGSGSRLVCHKTK